MLGYANRSSFISHIYEGGLINTSPTFGCRYQRKRNSLSCSIFSLTAAVRLSTESDGSDVLNAHRLLVFEGKSRNEIKKHSDAVYGDSSASPVIVKHWLNDLQRSRSSAFSEPTAPKIYFSERLIGLKIAGSRT